MVMVWLGGVMSLVMVWCRVVWCRFDVVMMQLWCGVM